MFTWLKEHAIANWKTTLVGFAQFVNGLVPCIQLYQTAVAGYLSPEEIRQLALHGAAFLFINGVLQQIKAVLMKDPGKGSDRPQEVVDAKLDNVQPFDRFPR